MYEWLKALHILMAVMWVGGAFAGQVLVSRLRKSDPVTMVKAALQLEWLGTHIFLPASLVMLGAGLWMVFGFEIWELTDAWVLIGLFGFLATVITGAAFSAPRRRRSTHSSRNAVTRTPPFKSSWGDCSYSLGSISRY